MNANAPPPKVKDNEIIETGRDVASQAAAPRALAPAARRALDEAQARRAGANHPPAAEEFGGRGGLDPARYGDWEKNGLASDF